MQRNPWEQFVDEHPIGSEVEGEIRNITEFGLFIGLSADIDGMVHMSDLSWDEPGELAMAKYEKGQMVKAKVLDVDVEKERISLGIKQLAGRSGGVGAGHACTRATSSPASSPRCSRTASR